MQVMVDVIFGLAGRYAEVQDVWVGGNLFFYEKGTPMPGWRRTFCWHRRADPVARGA
jgi:hypothetical protein